MNDALLVIDMLNDFVKPGAPLEVPKTRTIIPAISNQIAKARAEKRQVIFICDAHASDDLEFSRMNWPPHAIRGTSGAQVIDELKPEPQDMIIEKTSYSGFDKTGLEAHLKEHEIGHLTLTGCVTNICILYTAYDAVIHGYDVTVLKDCVADLDTATGEFAFRQMTDVLGVQVA